MKGCGARKIQKISCVFYIGRAQVKNFSLSKRKFGGGEVQIKKLLANNPPEFGFNNLPVARGAQS